MKILLITVLILFTQNHYSLDEIMNAYFVTGKEVIDRHYDHKQVILAEQNMLKAFLEYHYKVNTKDDGIYDQNDLNDLNLGLKRNHTYFDSTFFSNADKILKGD